MTRTIDFSRHTFAKVMDLPREYDVYDFTKGYDPERMGREWGVGRYNEKRRDMYTTEIFTGTRDNHMGIDIAAPVNTSVYAFADGHLHLQGYNAAAGDYGYTIVTVHVIDGIALYALHGHLSKASVELHKVGDAIRAGETVAYLGDKEENGGWNPHLHFQLSYEKPNVPDMPGVVADEDLERALQIYPDPQLVMGKLY